MKSNTQITEQDQRTVVKKYYTWHRGVRYETTYKPQDEYRQRLYGSVK